MDQDVTMNIDRVSELMTERGWTWADLAREMGMSKSTISRVVQGKTKPGRRYIFALERCFPDARRDELFTPAQRAAA